MATILLQKADSGYTDVRVLTDAKRKDPPIFYQNNGFDVLGRIDCMCINTEQKSSGDGENADGLRV